MVDTAVSNVKGAVAEARGRWARLKRRRPWVRHLADAWALNQRNNGSQYAAAITFFSFLALFPLLLLGVSVLGFVLHSNPDLLHSVLRKVTDNVPGQLGRTLTTDIQDAIKARTSVGIIGLAGVLLTGLGWIGNLRTAIDAVWGKPPAPRNFLVSRLRNLVVLAGLGIGIVVSLTLTVAGTALTDQILRALSLQHVSGVHVLLKVLGIAIAVVGDALIFWWLLVRLPAVEVPPRIALKGAVFAAVGFEVLKVVGTYTIAHTANSPTSGPFAGVLAVLVWIQLVARLMLFCCAWTSVLTTEAKAVPEGLPYQPPERPEPDAEPVSRDVRLVGTGALAGAFFAWVFTRSRQVEASRGDR